MLALEWNRLTNPLLDYQTLQITQAFVEETLQRLLHEQTREITACWVKIFGRSAGLHTARVYHTKTKMRRNIEHSTTSASCNIRILDIMGVSHKEFSNTFFCAYR